MRSECEKCQHFNIGFNKCEIDREEFEGQVLSMASRLNLCRAYAKREKMSESKKPEKSYNRFSRVRSTAGCPEVTGSKKSYGQPAEEKRKGVRPFVSFDGTYNCPCGAKHIRGPVNGERSYRCMKCGQSREVQKIDDFRNDDYINASGADEKEVTKVESESKGTTSTSM